ncbi:uncharacterized protein PAC_14562 [Phialocephala subalpina]|uniref:Rhodopsin domain-containing protein n=1 Tax=Phialocephala subalpina TaxID=576137 RepID=A0A1L7XI11_9HELO|nr:uncharacterized protein PAC_14562 [Phialocephala subalpina]
MANCTLAETLDLSKIQAAICERPYQSQNKKIRIMTIVCAIITNGAALIRFSNRLLLNQTFDSDDWFIAAAVLTEALFTTFGVQLEKNGFGEHVWNINLDAIPRLFYWFYICEILYVLTIGFIKISILFFYLRVFPRKSLRVACWATMAFCGASAVAFVLATIFQCHPIVYIWNKDMKGGRCVNYNSVAWANAAINIFQDIMIILLPMNELRHLQLTRKKKVGLYSMFGVGGFVCITSIVRLDSLRTFGLTADPTWDNIPTTFWSTLETTTAIFCACMPSIRASLVMFFPKVLGSTTHPISMGVGGWGDGLNSASPNSSNNKPIPFPIVEKPEQQFISLPLSKFHVKSNQAFTVKTNLSARINPTSDAAAEDDTTRKELIVQNASFTTAKRAAYVERNKPLPLTPIPKVSLSLILSTTTSTETEDRRDDVEKFGGTKNSPRTSDDTSRLV